MLYGDTTAMDTDSACAGIVNVTHVYSRGKATGVLQTTHG